MAHIYSMILVVRVHRCIPRSLWADPLGAPATRAWWPWSEQMLRLHKRLTEAVLPQDKTQLQRQIDRLVYDLTRHIGRYALPVTPERPIIQLVDSEPSSLWTGCSGVGPLAPG